MNDTFVTLHGWVGSEVTFRDPQGVSVANLRVATTPRLKREGRWVDGETTWYSVTAWRQLADNVRDSIRKGDAVIVHGRLRTDTWERADGQKSTTLCIEASMIGHDLARGTSSFQRAVRTERPDGDVDAQVDALNREEPTDLEGFDSFGNPLPSGDAAPSSTAGYSAA
jgi:single-strand DNA-binding protein